MKIVFVGETWNGSSARSLRDALAALPDIFVDDVSEDLHVPWARRLLLRGVYKAVRPLQRLELNAEIKKRIDINQPDAFVVYKGWNVAHEIVNNIKKKGIFTVNVFPDYSPHVYGSSLKRAMGEYDLVISTKSFHPSNWSAIYGYTNRCEFVPHGYEPSVHYWAGLPGGQDIDIVMVASWREQYDRLMRDLASHIGKSGIRVTVAGDGWPQRRAAFPPHWEFPGALLGRAYCEFARRGKIVIAPLHVENVVNGIRQPGDVDTTRSYELAAAGCFMLHRRTDYMLQVYDEENEVPMWDNVGELAQLIGHFLPREDERRRMALAAHQRAVPDYSIQSRATEIVRLMKESHMERQRV